MTDRAEIERLLNQTGRTLEGLPTQDDYWYSDDYVDRNKEIGMMMYRSGFIREEPYIMHQSDVIELLVGSLRDALDKRTKWISVKEWLPDSRRNILTVNGHGVIRIMALYGHAEGKWKWIEDKKFKYYNDITHWMPLPDEPKEERL